MTDPLHNVAGSLEARDLESLLHPSTNLKLHQDKGPLVLKKAEGVYVYGADGRRYIEGMAGLWCTALGYGEEELVEVAARQMRELCYSHLFAGRSHEPAIALAEKLKGMVPMEASKVFFANSGSEANDTQVKLAWYYNNAVGRPERKKIISRMKGYHGVTVAAGSLTGLPHFHASFDLPIPGVLHTSCPHHYRFAEAGESEEAFASRLADDLEALIQAEGPETIAAFIAEPIMGAGGVIVPPATYFEKIQAVLDRYGIWLIDDEVICGFGRTGNPFGAQTLGMRPTTMSFAKALSSAYLPISAVVIPDEIYEPFVEESGRIGTFGHGFTYSGHPVAAAVALRNLELMEERNLFAHAAEVGEYLQAGLAQLADHPIVGEVRGAGLIAGIELVADRASRDAFPASAGMGAYCSGRCEAHGLLARNLGDTIALCPPLIITREQVDEVLATLRRAIDETMDHATREGLLPAAA